MRSGLGLGGGPGGWWLTGGDATACELRISFSNLIRSRGSFILMLAPFASRETNIHSAFSRSSGMTGTGDAPTQSATVAIQKHAISFFIISERLKCGTAGVRRPERSELTSLSAVATTDLFARLVSVMPVRSQEWFAVVGFTIPMSLARL